MSRGHRILLFLQHKYLVTFKHVLFSTGGSGARARRGLVKVRAGLYVCVLSNVDVI